MKAMAAQGFVKDADGMFAVPESRDISMRIPTEMIPKCPIDGSNVVMNLRADDSFLEDQYWGMASAAYSDFLRRHEGLHVLYLEFGVGANTPVIIKYVFHALTAENPLVIGSGMAIHACNMHG